MYEYCAGSAEEIDLEVDDLLLVEHKVAILLMFIPPSPAPNFSLVNNLSVPCCQTLPDMQAPNAWCVRTNARTGKLGLFPSGFVELVKP